MTLVFPFLKSTQDCNKIESSYAPFGEEICKVWRGENWMFVCCDVHKFRMSGHRVQFGSLLGALKRVLAV